MRTVLGPSREEGGGEDILPLKILKMKYLTMAVIAFPGTFNNRLK